jgi:gliding motility-associated protein GldM
MALPKEPRQKMINIMYLVLTAMLALNVSAEILNAFKTVDDSLTSTNKTITSSTATIIKSLQDKADDPADPNSAKAKIWLPLAQNAQKLSTDMYNYIQDLRSRILTEAGFKPNADNKFDSSYKLDNLEVATRIMIKEKEGIKLKAKLEKYKSDLLDLMKNPAMQGLDAETKKQFENSIQLNLEPPKVQDKSNKTWDAAYFHMVPAVASVTILSKFQNDVKTTENRATAFFHQQVGHVVVRFTQFDAIIGQNSNYLMPGQRLEIKAGVGAFSPQAKPTISIGGQSQQIGDSGFVKYETMVPAGIGTRSIPVHITYQDQDGNTKVIDRVVNYTIGQSSTAISLPEMNVLYIGYPNKINVSGGGVGAEKISISVNGGGGRADKVANGEFIVKVSQQTDNCVISAYADGKQIGALTYRVRQMPEPTATVGGQKSGAFVNAATLAAQGGVGAYIENFPLNLRYSVINFNAVGVDEDGNVMTKPCQGNTFTQDARNMIKKMRSGDILTIENIYCVGPDGRRIKLPSLLYNIN